MLPRPVKLSVPALVLLRRLDSHGLAKVQSERFYPLTPHYTVRHVDGGAWALDSCREVEVAALAVARCLVMVEDRREHGVDTRVWRISPRGREVLEKKGVLVEAPEPEPVLFSLEDF